MTTPWRVIIADDEPLARRGVRQLLARHPAFAVVRECRDGREAKLAISAGMAEVVFLDIAMPGADGLEVATSRGADGPVVVFLTAHSRHAVEAFETAAADYLVKPVTAARFARTIERVEAILGARRAQAGHVLLEARTRTGSLLVPAADVDWIAGSNHYARLWVGQRSHLVRETLDALEARLAPAGFVRVHRSALVRLSQVRALDRDADGGHVAILASGSRVPVARRRAMPLRRALR